MCPTLRWKGAASYCGASGETLVLLVWLPEQLSVVQGRQTPVLGLVTAVDCRLWPAVRPTFSECPERLLGLVQNVHYCGQFCQGLKPTQMGNDVWGGDLKLWWEAEVLLAQNWCRLSWANWEGEPLWTFTGFFICMYSNQFLCSFLAELSSFCSHPLLDLAGGWQWQLAICSCSLVCIPGGTVVASHSYMPFLCKLKHQSSISSWLFF